MTEKPRPWFRRRKLLLSSCIVLVVLVAALALGLGLGLTLGRSDDDDDSSPPSSSPSSSPPSETTPLWRPKVGDTWQIILSHPPVISNEGKTTPDVDIFDIDLFDTPVETMNHLHDLGKKVICYFSAGSYEDWRSDASEFKKDDLGADLDGWAGEKWVDLKSENVRRIIKKRVEMAKEKGCDGVDPDNVDGYQNDNGLDLTQQDSVDFVKYLSDITSPLNLTLGLKNAGDIIDDVLPVVHFSVNEQCVEYNECDTFRPFIEAGKPVFHIEYPDGAGKQQLKSDTLSKICKDEDRDGFSTVLKKMEVDGWVEYCDGSVESTDVDESLGNHD